MDAHGGVLTAFGGSWGPKRVVWPVASWAKSPWLVFGVEFWVYDPGRFFGLYDLGEFWALEPMARFCGSFGAWKPKFKKRVREEFFGPRAPVSGP